jgi:hypothetical protein
VGSRLHPALIVVLALAICGGLILVPVYLRNRHAANPSALLARLPAQEGAILSVDLAALRRAGLLDGLAGTRVVQEPEYQAFLAQTGFDYQQDLDYAVAWFGNDSTHVLLRGRFDWRRLKAYAASQNGVCRNAFCRLEGSTPSRRISFFPLKTDVMALAVGPDEWAATALMTEKPQRLAMDVPSQPVWLLLPVSTLQSSERLPAGTRLFAKAMESAQTVLLSLASKDKLEIQLDVQCRSAGDASVLAFQLDGVTRLLKEMIAKENKTPNPGDLSGILAAGSFNAMDRRVLGRWPVGPEFLGSLLEDSQ